MRGWVKHGEFWCKKAVSPRLLRRYFSTSLCTSTRTGTCTIALVSRPGCFILCNTVDCGANEKDEGCGLFIQRASVIPHGGAHCLVASGNRPSMLSHYSLRVCLVGMAPFRSPIQTTVSCYRPVALPFRSTHNKTAL